MSDFIHPRPRPKRTHGATESAQTHCGRVYNTWNWDDEKRVVECFISIGSDGGCSTNLQMSSRLMSLYLRAGGDPWDIIDQIRNLRCPSSRGDKTRTSCPRAIATLLEKTLEELGHTRNKDKPTLRIDTPSDCGTCMNCGPGEVLVESIVTEMKIVPKDDHVPVWERAQEAVSRPDIDLLDSKTWPGGTKSTKMRETTSSDNKVPCPECGNALIYQEGCQTCPACAYSKCS